MHQEPQTGKAQQQMRRRNAQRRGQAPTPPAETSRRKAGFPTGMIVAGALGLLFISYLTNAGDVQTGIDSFFGAQVQSAHTHDAQISSWFLLLMPYVALALCLAALYVILASLGVGKSKPVPRVLTENLSIHEFAELALAQGVGARVAREMYRMLTPDHAQQMRSTLTRSFAAMGDSNETIWHRFEDLVQRCGGVSRGCAGVEALGTPIEMMQAAEQCLQRAALERRATLQKASALLEERSHTIVPLPAGRR